MEKKYFYINIFIILSLQISICIFNYRLDPYGIWKDNFDKQVLEPNKNYIKTKYIINNPNKYDSFIFGSSRVGYIEAELLNNGKYYNMTYSQGLPKEWYDNIQSFLKNGVEIKNIILGIDDFSFTVGPESHYNQPMRIPYNKLDNKIDLLKTYLLRKPLDLYNVKTIEGLIKKEYSSGNRDIYGTGRFSINFKNDEENIQKNIEKHVKDLKFNEPTIFYEYNRINETIKEIEDIKELCNDNGINLYIMFNPLHKTTYLANIDIVEEAKKELSKITSFWDFTGLNEVTTNNYYWNETSHYRLIVGRMILEKMFSIDLNVDNINNFGVYVEKQ